MKADVGDLRLHRGGAPSVLDGRRQVGAELAPERGSAATAEGD